MTDSEYEQFLTILESKRYRFRSSYGNRVPLAAPSAHAVGGAECKCNSERTCKLCDYACCELAQLRPCVCEISFNCVSHGKQCLGSHD